MLLTLLLLSACATQPAEGIEDWPHGAMATTANPYATDAAIVMLERGGHAVDAAIAAHLVLGLVEPQSSGIGGGGFMLVYERADQSLKFHDGRETAPSAATPTMFMVEGETMPFLRAWQSGKAVGVPGAIALYKQAHDRHGTLAWADLFEPAIKLAEEGFIVSPRLADFLPRMAQFSRLDENPGAASYFYPGGEPLHAGTRLRNPEYAATLRAVADQGPSAFYQGEIAEAIVAAVSAEPDPGQLSVEDIAGYEPRERDAICGGFRALSICSAMPPSSGAAQIMIAQLYDHLVVTDVDKLKLKVKELEACVNE